MIEFLNLKNFKCFDNTSIPFAPLTVMSGINGSGKTSAIQSLLLLRQSYDSAKRQVRSLVLRGSRIEIGSGDDILHEDAEEDFIEIEAGERNGHIFSARFSYDRESDELAGQEVLEVAHESVLFNSPMIVVPADRQGPQRIYPLSEMNAEAFQLGPKGEFALSLLSLKAGNLLNDDDPRRSNCPSKRVIDVVNFYVSLVSPGASLMSEKLSMADAIVARYKFERHGDTDSKGFKPINVGFGLSATMPVIIALISAPTNSIVLVENPEAHLHPRGQTELGYLCARAAAAQLQVVVETHSDHFLNGVRLAVKEGVLTSSNVSLPFFSRTGTKSSVLTPMLLPNGRIDFWPEGFFDQHEANLMKLL